MQINLIAPPLYVMTTQTLERSDGMQKLTEALEHIKLSIEKSGGVFTIKMQVGDTCFRLFYSLFEVSVRFLVIVV